jgi:hypothetical protein
MRIIAARDAGRRALSWREFLASNADLVGDARAVLGRHYTLSRLADPAARSAFLAPDLEALPCVERGDWPQR